MKLLTVDTLEEAREKVWARVKNRPLKSEKVSLESSLGRVLAEDIFVPEDIPGFDRATVDGYAVLSGDTAGTGEAIPVFLRLVGSVSMGKPAGFSIQSGECASVPTGGLVPAGADAVVMLEYSESAGESVAVCEAVAAGAGLVLAGEDLKKGEILFRKGTLIRPHEAGALAAAGITGFQVFAPPKLFIISTGDELVPAEQVPRPGEIRDINSQTLKGAGLKRGYSIVSTKVIPDDEALLESAVREAAALSDMVVISGGSSQGEKDNTEKIISRTASPGVFIHGLALKPGKPTILGWDDESQTLLAGLPGHPVAALIVFELILGWLSDKLSGLAPPFGIPARISCNVPSSPGRTLCLPVILHLDGDSYTAEPVFGKSGMITTLTRADGFILIDLNKEGLKKDEPVMVSLL